MPTVEFGHLRSRKFNLRIFLALPICPTLVFTNYKCKKRFNTVNSWQVEDRVTIILLIISVQNLAYSKIWTFTVAEI